MMMMMMSIKEAIETAMDIEACPACGDTGRIEVYIEHTDTDRTLHVEECRDCGDEVMWAHTTRRREESN